MALSVGIIGLPNVGKSTLLNALAAAGAEASSYPFCTIDCNQGVVPVPDGRLAKLAEILHPSEVIPSTITFVDIAGLVEGASRGEGLGNKFLHHVREADALAHVLRCFGGGEVSHVLGTLDPLRDFEIVETELYLADIERVERRIEKEGVKAKARRKGECRELDFLGEVREALSRQEPIRQEGIPEYQAEVLRDLRLLTMKPQIIVLNVGEEEGDEGDACSRVAERFGEERVFSVSARIESEIAAIPEEDRGDFMRELGISIEARDRFIEKCHEMLGLVRIYTTAHEKLQAWSVAQGTTAPQAAGRIHSDMERGFIRAEVMSFEDLLRFGSKTEVQHHGGLRTEGHDYVVRDGDIMHFLFAQT